MKTVFISAGHDNLKPGCVVGGLREADLALWLRNEVAAILRGKLVRVVTDGRDETNAPLKDAVKLAKENEGPSVEIHFNSGGQNARGVEAFSLPELKPLCQSLCREISKELQSPLRGEFGWKDQSQSQHKKLAFVEAGGIVLEVCFMTNSLELHKYLSGREAVAAAIAGVLERAANQ